MEVGLMLGMIFHWEDLVRAEVRNGTTLPLCGTRGGNEGKVKDLRKILWGRT